MYRCADDLNEAYGLGNIGNITFKYKEYTYTIFGIIQDPPIDPNIDVYLAILRHKKDMIDFYNEPCDICRLSMTEPKYIYSEYDIEKYNLNNDELNKIIEILTSEYHDTWYNRTYDSFWDYLMEEYQNIYGIDITKYEKIPNYKLLEK